jgi:peptide-methionine (R)-S-oxide reductase
LIESDKNMTRNTLTRRSLLASTTLFATGLGLTASPTIAESTFSHGDDDLVAYNPEKTDFPFEITRTEAEWREHFDNDDFVYAILRQAKTERPKTTELWLKPHGPGYLCRGCDLPIFEVRWFQWLNKGWVFFHHAVPQSVMLALDAPVPEYGQAGMLDEDNVVSEVHCRRCGSHLGHHLKVSGLYLHCINGTALKLA